jgi:SecD/SecF fusion protein
VRERIGSLSTQPGLKDLQSARVYVVGQPGDHRFEMQTTINNPQGDPDYVRRTLLDPLKQKFADVLETTPKVRFAYDELAQDDEKHIAELQDKGVVLPITDGSLERVFAKAGVTGIPNEDVTNFINGTAILIDKIDPPQSAAQLRERINNMRQSSEAAKLKAPYREFQIIPVAFADGASPAAPPSPGAATQPQAGKPLDTRPLTRAVMVSVDTAIPYNESTEALWQDRVASTEWKILAKAMADESSFPVTTFDPVVADQAKQQALVAIFLSLILIVIYVWVRFGGFVYGVGAILSLAHDAIVALAATVLSGVVYDKVFGGHPNWLLLSDFKINLTMIAAYLTIIGYSVNDTIVIFDRVRELRGRSQAPLSAKLINDAINQCFGRTIWTTFTVFIVVLIMYIWGGEGVRGFSFAMLVGVFTGAYSTLAIASPMLLTTAGAADKAGPTGGAPRRPNPFLKRENAELPEAAPTAFKPNPGPAGGPNVGPSGA